MSKPEKFNLKSKSREEFQSISDSLKDMQLKNQRRKANFCDLPDLAIEKILNCLDAKSMQNFRQVSKWTKALVEHPSHIVKLQLQIRSRKYLEKILKSELRWNNFYFSNWKNWMPNKTYKEQDMIFDNFFQKFGPFMKIFKSDLSLGYSIVNQLLKQSKDLNVIDIQDSHFPAIFEDPEEEEQIQEHCSQINFENLRHLNIYRGSHLRHILESVSGLPKLQYLRIYDSRITGSSFPYDSFNPVVDSLKAFLKKRSENPKLAKLPLTMDFGGPGGLSRFWERDWNFDLRFDDLAEICKLCYLIPGTTILNVNSKGLPKYADENLRKYLECIKSVLTISDLHSESLKEFYIPPGCDMNHVEEIKDQDYANYYLPPDGIKSMKLMLNCWAPAFYQTWNLYGLLDNIFRPRPSLEEFIIYRETTDYGERDELNARLDFSCFPNLKKLSVSLLEVSKEQFWTFCEHLKMLEEMDIQIYSLSDEYLIGPDENPHVFLNLSRLKSLSLKYWSAKVTDVTLLHVFSRMSLNKLKLDCKQVTHQITFDGLTRLLSGTSFGKSVKNLEMQKPIDCTMGQCKALVRENCEAMEYYRFNNEQEKQRSNVQCKFIYSDGK